MRIAYRLYYVWKMSQVRGTGRKKIAVLGGGIAALAAVFDLTRNKNWQSEYDITVYQMGWRLGGKGASSRNPRYSNRIEEHGLHIWLGFYENAFQLMRECYAQLPAGGGTFANWQDAFKPHSFAVLEEQTSNGWLHWPITTPTNDSLPGDGHDFPSLWDYVQMAIEAAEQEFENLRSFQITDEPVVISGWSSTIMEADLSRSEKAQLPTPSKLLRAAHHRAKKTSYRSEPSRRKEVSSLLDDFSHWFSSAFLSQLPYNTEMRRTFVFIDLLCAAARGMIADGVVTTGFDALDDFELRDWLRRHGASDISVNSAFIRAGYDLAFSFESGDSTKLNLAAGTALRALSRLAFCLQRSRILENAGRHGRNRIHANL